ncbi:MAG: hypothetical protein JSV16_06940 [Candidatus Hydrogenedentota bacterium]|nr:MAG: hypothetical protein JSV16_06940 [Candidatus Hydrogenedentota bacterium]
MKKETLKRCCPRTIFSLTLVSFLVFAPAQAVSTAQEAAQLDKVQLSQLLRDACAHCHNLNRVILETDVWTIGEWMHAFDEMAKADPELSQAQKTGIIQYLDANRAELKLEPLKEPAMPEGMTAETHDVLYKNRCITCHDATMLDRVAEGLSREDCEHIVDRMIKKAPRFLADIDRERVVDYLYKFKMPPEMVREMPAEAKKLTENIYYRMRGSVELIAERRDTYTFNDDNKDEDTGFKRKGGFAEILAYYSVDFFHPEGIWAARVSGALDYLNDRGNSELKRFYNGRSNETYFDASFEEAWLEAKVFDTSNKLRIGLQEYKSDFVGLIYNDNDLGARLCGEKEKLTWNLAYFYKTEHDAVSELFDPEYADQNVFIATVQFNLGTVSIIPSVHYNRDRRDDRELDVTYLGIAHYGMIGPFATTSAFYYAFGEDDNAIFNPARDQDISALLIVADVGYPIGKFTPHLGVFYGSGDDDPSDGHAEGFDSIYDNINVWGENGIIIDDRINLGRTTLMRDNSGIPSVRDFYEAANFINPGVLALNAGLVANWTEKFATDMNLMYFIWDETALLDTLMGTDVGDGGGVEANFTSTYKFDDNLSVTAAAAVVFTDDDMKDIFGGDDNPYNLYLNVRYAF